MGVGDQPSYFLLAFAALWPILLNTAAGVRQLDPRWLQLSRSLAATPAGGQRLRFSATLDNGVDKLVRRFLSSPTTHSVD
ncbi:hypothetical protein KQ718_17600, partial [Listeria monocytogenes]|nr:hypothetical protein [Listeria monocytogenes]